MGRILLFLLLFPVLSSAQKQGRALIDSLVARLPAEGNDTVKARLYRVIADESFFSNVDQAMHYSRLGLRHTTGMNWPRGIGVFNAYVGRAHSDKGDYDSCRYYFLKAITIYKSLNDTWNLASTTNNLGVAEQNIRSNYPAAMRYYFEGLAYAEVTGDNYLIGLCLDNVSEIYRVQKNFPKALQFGQRALALRQRQSSPDINARRELAAALTSIAAIYTEMKNWPKARQHGFQALGIHKEIDNKDGLAKTYGNLSVAMQQDFGQKISYALNAKKIWDEINPRHLTAVSNVANLGIAYLDLVRSDTLQQSPVYPTSRAARLQLAEKYLTEAIRLSADKGEIGDQAHFRGSLAELQALAGNFKGAYENFRLYQAVQDSLYSQEAKNKIAGLEGKREIELRDKQLQINRLTIDGQRRQQLALLVCVGLLLVIGGLLYWQGRSRKRTNTTLLHLNQELDEANQVKARFFAILSHDLRSPIANLINFLHLQQTSPDLLTSDQVSFHQQKITDAAEGLLDTMELMLLWSKSQMQQFRPTAKVIRVEKLFEYMKRFFAEATHVQFSFEMQDDLQVVSDEDYLRTILQNLTSNAVKALQNQPDARIAWEARREGDEVVLIIRDNGPGLSENQLQVLHNSDAVVSGKTGFGLHMVRDLARSIACRIAVDSGADFGTEFRLTIGKA
ncbi:sensor histidine kinase [Dyadobacter soli]|nr:tetratricopeptide repeat-containing sensor histidine kinase [Dyadobacter soli]